MLLPCLERIDTLFMSVRVTTAAWFNLLFQVQVKLASVTLILALDSLKQFQVTPASNMLMNSDRVENCPARIWRLSVIALPIS